MSANSTTKSPGTEDSIDSSVLEGYHFLRSVSGHDMLSGFIDEFLVELPGHLQTIALAVGRGDANSLISSARPLKASAAAIGARPLVALATELEQAGRRGSISTAVRLYQRLEEAADRARLALQGLRAA